MSAEQRTNRPDGPADQVAPEDAVTPPEPAAEETAPEQPAPEEVTDAAAEETPPEEPADAAPADAETGDADTGEADTGEADTGDADTSEADTGDEKPAAAKPRRRRDPLAAALIGVLTLLLGFAFAVQVRNTGTDQVLAGAREEDLVRILDELNAREDRFREQIAEQRAALEQLGNSDSRSATALEEARKRADAIGILNGTIAARGPGLRMTIRDPADEVRVADVLDAIQELRGAGAETMQIDGVRVGVSTAVTGEPGALKVDGHAIAAPYEFVVIGSPQNMETAMNIPGGAVQRITGRGGSVTIRQSDEVVVDALRPLDEPQYASPSTGG